MELLSDERITQDELLQLEGLIRRRRKKEPRFHFEAYMVQHGHSFRISVREPRAHIPDTICWRVPALVPALQINCQSPSPVPALRPFPGRSVGCLDMAASTIESGSLVAFQGYGGTHGPARTMAVIN